MNTRTVLTIAAVITLIIALGVLLTPTFMGTLLGVNPSEILLPRFFGST